MRTTNFDAIATSAPLDKTASVVRDGSGDHYDPEAKQQEHWLTCPPIAPAPHNAPDLTGQIIGRLTVKGYYAIANGKGARWVVRCTCGGYETRRTKAITKPGLNDCHEPMCCKCGRFEAMKRNAKAAIKGRWEDGRPVQIVGLKTSAGDRLLQLDADRKATPGRTT